ncbi:MAG: hypothetical protein IT183_00625 [Acidobacteria bacterium]|nr:hypothetical protein [Acidobacteriota bacterium]
MTDEELMQYFEAGTPPPGGFHHEQHVHVVWCYLRRHSRDVALERFRSGLRHFAEAQGAPQRYHETITTAFVLLIAERLGEDAQDPAWEAFAARHADLLAWKPSILDRYYTPETLASERARHTFVPPDGAGVLVRFANPGAPAVD